MVWKKTFSLSHTHRLSSEAKVIGTAADLKVIGQSGNVAMAIAHARRTPVIIAPRGKVPGH